MPFRGRHGAIARMPPLPCLFLDRSSRSHDVARGALVDALNRPEARRDGNASISSLCSSITIIVRVTRRIPGAETALFDEGSGPLRLAALRFLCKLGSTTEARSERVWPLIDEAIQCYHGDLEFSDMLSAVTDFSIGNLSLQVEEGACRPHGVRRLEWPGSAQTARSANSRQRK